MTAFDRRLRALVCCAASAALVGACSGGGTSGTAGSRIDTPAQAAHVEKFLEPPTTLGVSEPLPAPPKPGGLIVRLTNEFPQEQLITDAVTEAADAIGWEIRVLTYESADPASFHAAMAQALEFEPDAVTFDTVPYAVFQSDVGSFEDAGVPLVPVAVGDADVNDTTIANINGPDDAAVVGELMANWFINDSGGIGKAVVHTIPDFPYQKAWEESFTAVVADECVACEVIRLERSGAQALAGGANTAIVSELQRNPDANYLIMDNLALTTGLPQALQAASIDVKIAGSQAGRADQQLVQQGDVAAATPISLSILGWMVVDSVLRHEAGLKVLPDAGGLPNQLLTPDNIGTPTDSFDAPADFRDRYRAMWLVD